MKLHATPIAGLWEVQTEPRGDERGQLTRLFCPELFADIRPDLRFVQTNLSYTAQRGTVRGMHYQVYLNDMRLATGVTDRAFDVPAYGTEYFDVTVRSNIWRHLSDLVKLVEHQQPVNYRIDGHIRTGLFMSPKLTLQEEGTIDPADMRF